VREGRSDGGGGARPAVYSCVVRGLRTVDLFLYKTVPGLASFLAGARPCAQRRAALQRGGRKSPPAPAAPSARPPSRAAPPRRHAQRRGQRGRSGGTRAWARDHAGGSGSRSHRFAPELVAAARAHFLPQALERLGGLQVGRERPDKLLRRDLLGLGNRRRKRKRLPHALPDPCAAVRLVICRGSVLSWRARPVSSRRFPGRDAPVPFRGRPNASPLRRGGSFGMKRCLETSPPACSSPVPAVGVQQFSIERVPSSPRSPVLLDELPIARNQGFVPLGRGAPSTEPREAQRTANPSTPPPGPEPQPRVAEEGAMPRGSPDQTALAEADRRTRSLIRFGLRDTAA